MSNQQPTVSMKTTVFVLLVFSTCANATINHNQSQQNTRLHDTHSQEPLTSTISNTSTLPNTNLHRETEEFLNEDNLESSYLCNEPESDPQNLNIMSEFPETHELRSYNLDNLDSNSTRIQEKKKWTASDEAQLFHLFEKFEFDQNKWEKMSSIMGRSQNALRVYYLKRNRDTQAQKTHKKENWSVEEEARVFLLFDELRYERNKWKKMSSIIGRSEKALKEYYLKNIGEFSDFELKKNAEWSVGEEDKFLLLSNELESDQKNGINCRV